MKNKNKMSNEADENEVRDEKKIWSLSLKRTFVVK